MNKLIIDFEKENEEFQKTYVKNLTYNCLVESTKQAVMYDTAYRTIIRNNNSFLLA